MRDLIKGLVMQKKNAIFYFIMGAILLLGVVYRVLSYCQVNVFEDDECRIILAIMDKQWWELFFSLNYEGQSGPPLFLLIEKFFGEIFNYTEKALKFFPFVCSLLSMFVFYKFTKKVFTNKLPIVLSNFLFVINTALLMYSVSAKQYSSDVLMCLLCIYYLADINLKELSKKKIIILSLVLALLPLISLPTIFFIASFVIIKLAYNLKDKEYLKLILLTIIPLIIMLFLYYLFNLHPSKLQMLKYFPTYWDECFVGFGIKNNILYILLNLFHMFFYPNGSSVYSLILFIGGLGYLIEDKSIYSKFILSVFGFTLLASITHMYPIVLRVSLFALPLVIICIIKPFDYIKFNNWKFYVILPLLILAFCGYNLSYNSIYKNITATQAKDLMTELVEKYNPKTDRVFVNDASSSSFIFYARKNNFVPNEYTLVKGSVKNLKETLDSYLLESRKERFWFYIVKDFVGAPNREEILAWANTKNIIYKKKIRRNFLILIEK